MGNNIEKDTLELVLKEILDEQENTNKIHNDLVAAINQLTGKVNSFTEKLDKQKITAPTIDTKGVQEIIKKGVTDMELIAGSQPKAVVKRFQILLFPEQDAKLFYKIVFGRWFVWLAIMLFLNLFYKWAIYKSDNDSHTLIETAKNDKIIKAWSYLYSLKNKETQRKMDSALLKVSQAKD